MMIWYFIIYCITLLVIFSITGKVGKDVRNDKEV